MEEKGHFINTLPDSGLVTFLAVVRERELRPRRSGGVYLHLLLGDKTGEIQGRVWDGAEEIARLFEADDILKVRGTLEQYNGKSQLMCSAFGAAKMRSSTRVISVRFRTATQMKC